MKKSGFLKLLICIAGVLIFGLGTSAVSADEITLSDTPQSDTPVVTVQSDIKKFDVNGTEYTTLNEAVNAVNTASGDVVFKVPAGTHGTLSIDNVAISKLTIEPTSAGAVSFTDISFKNMKTNLNIDLKSITVNGKINLENASGLVFNATTAQFSTVAIHGMENTTLDFSSRVGAVNFILSGSIGGSVINGGNGNDVFTLNEVVATDLVLDGKAGTNKIVSNISGELTFEATNIKSTSGDIAFANISNVEDTASDHSIVTLPDSDNAIAFTSDAGNIKYDLGGVGFVLNGTGKITVLGGSGNDTITLNGIANPNLTQFSVDGGNGNDKISVVSSITLSNADVKLVGEQIEIVGAKGNIFNILAKSLTLEAKNNASSASKVESKVTIRYAKIQVSADIRILSNGSQLVDIDGQGTSVVKNIDTKSSIELESVEFIASNINISSAAISEISGDDTKSRAVNNISNKSHLSIFGDSSFRATNNLMFSSVSKILSAIEVGAGEIPISIAMNSIVSEALLTIDGNTKLNSSSVAMNVDNIIDSKVLADGSRAPSSQSEASASGAFIAIHNIRQITKGDIGENVKIGGINTPIAKDVSLKVNASLKLDTQAKSIGDGYKGSTGTNISLQGVVQEIKDLLKLTPFADIAAILSDDMLTILGSVNASSETALTKQMVGAFAFNNVKMTTSAKYKADSYITGNLNVISNASINTETIADGSAKVDVGEAVIPIGIGVAVALHKVDYENTANVAVSTLRAKDVNVLANESANTNTSKIVAKAGVNRGDFGIGGAFGITIYNITTKATIDSSQIQATGNVNVITNDKHDVSIDADCSSDKAVGAGIAVLIFEDIAMSQILDSVKILSVKDLNVLTNSISNTILDVKSGGNGGLSIAPGVAVNINLNDILSQCLAATVATGDINVKSVSKKTRKTTSASNLVDKGGIGATVSLVINIDKNKALLGGKVSGREVHVHATSHHRSDAYATASPEGESDPDPDAKETSPEDLVNKLRGAVDQLMGNEGDDKLSDKFSADMSTQEGKIQVAGAVIVVYLETKNEAIIENAEITADKVEVLAKEAVAIYNFANANVSDGVQTGAATAVIVLVSDIQNKAQIKSNVTMNVKALSVVACGDTLEKVNELAKDDNDNKTVTNDKNTFANVSLSGAGASKNGIAGAVVLVFVDQAYDASVDGKVTVLKQDGNTPKIEIKADLKERFYSRGFSEAKYVAGGNNNSTNQSKSKGIAPSFVMNYCSTTANAILASNGAIKTATGAKADVLIQTTFDSSIDAEAEAGSGEGKTATDITIDGAVVLNLLSRDISAKILAGGVVNVTGTLSVLQKTTSTTNAKVHAGAEAKATAVGAAVAVTYFKAKYAAIVSGSVSISGKLSVISEAKTIDIVEATGTSKGVSEKDFKDKFKDFDLKKVLKGESFGSGESTKTGDTVAEFTGGKADQNTSSSILGATNVTTMEPDTNGKTNPKKGEQVAIAAAVAVTILQHDVLASMDGIAKAGEIEIKAINDNNFKSYNGSKASSNGTAITLSVAVAILGSKTEAYGNMMESLGDITISASGSINMDETFKNAVTLLAVGMASVGKEGELSLAGSIAFLKYENVLKAMILENAEVKANGKVSVTAIENNKLAAKAWNYAGAGNSNAVAVGTSFAMIFASSTVQAIIAKGAKLELDALYVEAKRKRVNPNELSFNFEYKEGMFDDFDAFDYIDITNFLASNNYYIEVLGASNASKGNLALQGSFGILMFDNITEAKLEAGVEVTAINDITIKADSDVNVKVITGGVANANQVGIGLNTGTIVDESKVTASIGNAVKLTTNTGGVLIDASSRQDYLVVSVAASKATTAGIAGVVNVILSKNKVNAIIGNQATVIAKKDIQVLAKNDSSFKGISLGATKGGKAGVGCTAAVILIENETNASVGENVTLKADGNIIVKATSSEDLAFIITSAAVSDNVAIGLSGAYAQIESSTIASIGDGHDVTALNLNIETASKTVSKSINGGVTAAGTVAVSGTTTSNVIKKKVKSLIGKGRVNTKNNIVVKVDSEEKILAIVVAVGASKSVAVQGSVPVTIIENDILASIDGEVIATDISISAKDKVDADVYAGGIGASSSVAIGAAVNTLYIQGKVIAQIADSANITAANLSIIADSENNILTTLISGAASGTVSVVGVVNTVLMSQQTKAVLGNSVILNIQKDILLKANAVNDFTCYVGALSAAGTVAVGASVNTVKLENIVSTVIGKTVEIIQNTDTNIGNLTLLATGKDSFFGVVAGIAGSGSVAVSASANTILNTSKITTEIGTDSNIKMGGSLYVKAYHDLMMKLYLGTTAVSVYAGVGTSVLVVVSEVAVANNVGDSAILNFTGSKTNTATNGITFVSASDVDIMSVVTSAAGGAAGVSPTSATFVLSGSTKNVIGDNASFTTDKKVSIDANSNTTIAPYIGSAGVGVAGIGASVLVINSSKETSTYIGKSASIKAVEGISISATSKNSFTGLVIGFSGGAVGVAASVNAMIIEDIVNAVSDTGSSLISSNGAVSVLAKSTQNYDLQTYTTSIGGAAVQASNATITFKSVINAALANAEALKDILVHALAEENIGTQIVGGAAGGIAVGGSVAVIISNNTINSYIQDASTLVSNGNITIKADDSLSIDSKTASLNLGSIAVGAGVNVILIQNTIAAYIGNKVNVSAANTLSVLATLNRVVSLKSLAASGGLVSGNGTVSVISLGITNDEVMNNAAKNDVSQANTNVQEALKTLKVQRDNSNSDGNDIIDEANTSLDDIQFDLLGYLINKTENNKDKTSSYIGEGSTIKAKNIVVSASEANEITLHSAAASIGAAGAGASVLVLKHGSYIRSYVGKNTSLSASEDIDVSAKATKQKYTINSVAGSAGVTLALGAAVTYMDIRGVIEAYLNDNVIVENVRNLNVNAIANYVVDTHAIGASLAGAGAVGASVLVINLATTIRATINDKVEIKKANDIKVHANLTNVLNAKAMAGAAGLLGSGQAVVLTITIAPSVSALLKNSVKVLDSSSISLWADADVKIDATITGASMAYGVAGGASVMTITNNAKMTAGVGTSGNITTGTMDVYNCYNTNKDGSVKADRFKVSATSVSGALYASLNGLVVTINDFMSMDTYLGGTIKAGAISVKGIAASMLDVTAKGFSVGLGALNAIVLNVNSKQNVLTRTLTSAQIEATSLSVNSEVYAKLTVKAEGTNGGAFTAGAVVATATLNPSIQTHIGDSNVIKTTGAVDVKTIYNVRNGMIQDGILLTGNNAGGGAITANYVDLTAIHTASIITAVNANSKITAGGDINVLTYAGLQASAIATAKAIGAIGIGDTKTNVNVGGSITTSISTGVELNASTIRIKSYVYGKAISEVIGASFGGLSVGASRATVTLNPVIETVSGLNAKLTATKDIQLVGYYNMKTTQPTAENPANDVEGNLAVIPDLGLGAFAKANGSSGNLTGVIGTQITVNHNTKVRTIIKANGQLVAGNSIFTYAYSAIQNSPTLKTDSGGLVSVGANQVKSTIQVETLVKVENSATLSAQQDIHLISYADISASAETRQSSGGLVNGGALNSAETTITSSTKIELGQTVSVKALANVFMNASTKIVNSAISTGKSVSGVAIGESKAINTITSTTKVIVGKSSTITAGDVLSLIAIESIKATATSLASEGVSILGSSKGATANITINENIGIEVANLVTFSAKELILLSTPIIEVVGNANATNSGIVALGEISSDVTLSLNNKIMFGDNTKLLSTGDLIIQALSDITVKVEGTGGSYGAFPSAVIKNTVNITNAVTSVSFANNNEVVATGTLKVNAETNLVATVKSIIKGSHGFVAHNNNAKAIANVNVNNTINLGVNGVYRGKNIYIFADIKTLNITTYAESKSYTASSKTYIDSLITVNANVTITATNVTLAATHELHLYSLISNFKMSAKTDARIIGVTGSIFANAKANANIKAKIIILGADSVLMGNDINIKASSPVNTNLVSVLNNHTEVDTVVEYVLVAVRKTMQVVREVTKKIVKWLPWPFNKLVKWIVETIVETVEYFVNELVPKVLNSEIDKKEENKYNRENTITLNGKIYYGSSVPIEITIDKDGNISSTTGATAYKDKDGNIHITSFGKIASGSLIITSYAGEVNGNVTVYRNVDISMIKVVNESPYNIYIGGINFNDEDIENPEHVITANINNLEILYVSEGDGKTRVIINSLFGGDIVFESGIELLNGILELSTNADIKTTADANLRFKELKIYKARNVGSADNRFTIYLADEGLEDSYITIDAAENVYLSVSALDFIDLSEEAFPDRKLQIIFKNVSVSGKFDVRTSTAMYIENILLIDFGKTKLVPITEIKEIWEWDPTAGDDGMGAYVFLGAQEIVIGYKIEMESGESITPKTKPAGLEVVFDGKVESGETYFDIKDSDFIFSKNGSLNSTYNTLITKGNLSTQKTSGIDILGKSLILKIDGMIGSEQNVILTAIDTLQAESEKDVYVKNNKLLTVKKLVAEKAYLTAVDLIVEHAQSDVLKLYSDKAITANISVNNLFAQAIENIVITNDKTLTLEGVTTNANIKITVDGNLLGNKTSAYHLKGKELSIHSNKGIGNATTYLKTHLLTDGFINVEAKDNVYIEEITGNLIIKAIDATNKAVHLKAKEGILGLQDGTHIYAKDVYLDATKSIGSATRYLNIKQDAGGKVVANSLENIYLHGVDGLAIESIQTAKDVFLSAKQDIMAVGNGAHIVAVNTDIRSTLGNVGSSSNRMVLNTSGLVKAYAKESVYLTHTGRLTIDKIEAGKVVDLKAVDIFSDTTPAIKANKAILTATNALGSSLERLYMSVSEFTLTAKNAYISNDKDVAAVGESNIQETLDLEVSGSLSGSSGHLLKANKLKVVSDASVGSMEAKMNLSVNVLDVVAKASVYFKNDSTKDLRIEKIHAGDTVDMYTGNVIAGDIHAKFLNGVSTGAMELHTTIDEVALQATKKIALYNNTDVLIHTIQSGERVFIQNAGQVSGKAGVVNIKASELEMVVSQGIGNNLGYVTLNVSGNIKVTADKSIYLHETKGNMNIDLVKTKETAYLKAEKSILNASTQNNIEAQKAVLEAGGSIGLKNKLLKVDLSGSLYADGNGVFVEETSGDLIIDQVNAHNKDVILSTNASLFGESNKTHIIGNNIELRTKGSIGTSKNALQVKQSATGILNATAKNNIYLYGTDTLGLGALTSDENIYLSAYQDIENRSDCAYNLKAKSVTLESIKGDIGSKDKKVILKVPKEIYAKAYGGVYLSHYGSDMNIGKIEAGTNVVIDAQENIFGSSSPSIIADAAVINAKKVIGSRSERFVLDVNKLTVNAAKTYLTNLKSLHMCGDSNVESVFDLYVKGNLTSAKNANVSADTLIVKASGNIGNSSQGLNTSVSKLYANAKDNIYIVNASDKDLHVKDITSSNIVNIISGNIVVDNVKTDALSLTSSKNATVNAIVNKLNMKVSGNATFTNAKDLLVEKVSVGKNITLHVNGNILANKNTLLDAVNMTIRADKNIGSANAWLKLKSKGGVLNIKASEYMYVEDLASMRIGSMTASNAIHLKATGSITGGGIQTNTLHLQAGQIGQGIQSKLSTNVKTLYANASGNIYLKNAGSLNIKNMVSKGNIYLEATSILGDMISANYLEAIVSGTLQFTSSVNRMKLQASTIQVRNTRSVILDDIRAQSVTINNVGNVTSNGRIYAETIGFNIQGNGNLKIAGSKISGSASGNLKIHNNKSMSITTATKLQAGGNLEIEANGKIHVAANASLRGNSIKLVSSLSEGLEILGKLYAKTTALYGGLNNKYIIDQDAGDVSIYSRVSNSYHAITLLSLANKFVFNGSSGKDTVQVDMKNFNATSSKQFIFDGAGGDDVLTLDLKATGTNNHYTIKNINRLELNGQTSDDTYEIDRGGFAYDQGNGKDTYDVSNIGSVKFNAQGGNNVFKLIDTFAKTEILGGNGNNTFYIGVIVNDSTNATKTTEGYLSRGTSHDTTIRDGSGNSTYRIYSTKGSLVIYAGEGSDIFTVKAFITYDDNGDLIPYRNKGMEFHGDSNDKVIIIKSALFDMISHNGDEITAPGIMIKLFGIDDVEVEEFTRAKGSTAAIATFDFILYNMAQLHSRGILIPLIIGIILLLLAIGYLIYRKRKKKLNLVTS
ncbi:hypothetical protein M2475_000202 [Breznakia sp. PF5-3]|uniref:beta strand repeat-containing protein n=1 Tax=unclassified Breznakia TaxID=2623764 RepID=UPI0024076E99|nr:MULTISPECIES: hypothetical protein [unclassified Breznakia]MDF9823781.1 hypothetical protein [Breznakia sp. PM6-1]MDF9834653.1 hypothetical protein [Breznakia sp. PF5-3]MDF9836730.1 hypothetical protein [Breznakia sp. PFB2-8]MDF9858821.1 hypothetical protein [Breznakia sp. PH5-24]